MFGIIAKIITLIDVFIWMIVAAIVMSSRLKNTRFGLWCAFQLLDALIEFYTVRGDLESVSKLQQ